MVYLGLMKNKLSSVLPLLLFLNGCASLQGSLRQLANESQHVNRDLARSRQGGVSDSGIVNGKELSATDPESKLATLLLITRGSNLSACTGVLIKKRVILTAAHCVQGVEPKNVRVVFKVQGDPASTGPTDFKAEKIVIHEKFNGSPEGFSDLALVKLSSDAPKAYTPIPLLSKKDKRTDDQVLLIGYGITGEDKKDSMTLRETKKSFKDDLHLKDGYFGIDQKSASGGFCRGDSGAPILVKVGEKRKLLGINSFTVGIEDNKECHTASVAMPSDTFGGWIDTHAKKL